MSPRVCWFERNGPSSDEPAVCFFGIMLPVDTSSRAGFSIRATTRLLEPSTRILFHRSAVASLFVSFLPGNCRTPLRKALRVPCSSTSCRSAAANISDLIPRSDKEEELTAGLCPLCHRTGEDRHEFLPQVNSPSSLYPRALGTLCLRRRDGPCCVPHSYFS